MPTERRKPSCCLTNNSVRGHIKMVSKMLLLDPNPKDWTLYWNYYKGLRCGCRRRTWNLENLGKPREEYWPVLDPRTWSGWPIEPLWCSKPKEFDWNTVKQSFGSGRESTGLWGGPTGLLDSLGMDSQLTEPLSLPVFFILEPIYPITSWTKPNSRSK